MTAINKNIILLAIVILSHTSFAVVPEDFLYPNALNVPCKEDSPMQEDLMYCVSREYIESDKILNLIYQKLFKKLNFIGQRKIKLE